MHGVSVRTFAMNPEAKMREHSRTFSFVTERPDQQPEGRLINEARKRARLSQRAAAEASGLSEARWRQIVSGYQPMGGNYYHPVVGPPYTIARMAEAVGLTPDELTEVGREDAADELTKLLQSHSEARPESAEDPLDLTTLTPEEIAIARATIQALRDARGHGEQGSES